MLELCQARKEGLTAALPVARKKVNTPVRRQVVLIICTSAGFLLRQRPPQGFLGGMWEFPTIDLSAKISPARAAARLLSDLGLHVAAQKAGEVRHAYSHFKLELMVYRVDVEQAGQIAETSCYRWRSDLELNELPVHGAHKKAYKTL